MKLPLACWALFPLPFLPVEAEGCCSSTMGVIVFFMVWFLRRGLLPDIMFGYAEPLPVDEKFVEGTAVGLLLYYVLLMPGLATGSVRGPPTKLLLRY